MGPSRKRNGIPRSVHSIRRTNRIYSSAHTLGNECGSRMLSCVEHGWYRPEDVGEYFDERFNGSRFAQKFAEILQLHGVQPQSFCLEITESAIMDDPQRAHQTLDKLHAMGMELSIDDFGTGYSSLAYLKRLPVDELKIDKSFVLKMEQDIDDTKIVKSTIDLGHNMGLRVVAEGIENAEVMALLKELGCDQAQGYFISRPMPVTNMPAWLNQWRTSQPA